MQITFPINLVKKIFNTKKEFFFYKLNNSNEVYNYTLTNNPKRYFKNYNNKFCLVSELKVKLDGQLYINFSESNNDIFQFLGK